MPDSQLEAIANRIHDRGLRKKVAELLKDPVPEISGRKYSALPFDKSPAALSHHHSYAGGYVDHVASTAIIASAMCDCAEQIYHGRVNRDLVLAGVLLHDVFKPALYEQNEDGSYTSTCLSDYLDHLSLATSELARRGFPVELIHIVASHHGNYGPIRPHTVEALICQLADLADSQLDGEILRAASYLTRRVGGELFGLNSKEAFEIVRSKAIEGWKGVSKTAEKIGRRRASRKT